MQQFKKDRFKRDRHLQSELMTQVGAVGLLDPCSCKSFIFEDLAASLERLVDQQDKLNHFQPFFINIGVGAHISKFILRKGHLVACENIYQFGSKMLMLLEAIHSCGYVYNNMKFENVITSDRQNIPKKGPINFKEICLNLMDFGLATPYIDFKTGKHLKQKKVDILMGEYLFASIDRLNFLSTSRRDDLISLCYMMLYMLNG